MDVPHCETLPVSEKIDERKLQAVDVEDWQGPKDSVGQLVAVRL